VTSTSINATFWSRLTHQVNAGSNAIYLENPFGFGSDDVITIGLDTAASEENVIRIAGRRHRRGFHVLEEDPSLEDLLGDSEGNFGGGVGGGGTLCNGVADPANCVLAVFCDSTPDFKQNCPVLCDSCRAPRGNGTTTAVPSTTDGGGDDGELYEIDDDAVAAAADGIPFRVAVVLIDSVRNAHPAGTVVAISTRRQSTTVDPDSRGNGGGGERSEASVSGLSGGMLGAIIGGAVLVLLLVALLVVFCCRCGGGGGGGSKKIPVDGRRARGSMRHAGHSMNMQFPAQAIVVAPAYDQDAADELYGEGGVLSTTGSGAVASPTEYNQQAADELYGESSADAPADAPAAGGEAACIAVMLERNLELSRQQAEAILTTDSSAHPGVYLIRSKSDQSLVVSVIETADLKVGHYKIQYDAASGTFVTGEGASFDRLEDFIEYFKGTIEGNGVPCLLTRCAEAFASAAASAV
jgi:hypothetical protein